MQRKSDFQNYCERNKKSFFETFGLVYANIYTQDYMVSEKI